MRILILGGTVFLGRTIAEAALAAGHEVTLFNRGKSNPGAVAGVETLIGDRTTDLGMLKGRTWDAVIDPSGYVPRHVGMAARMLRDSTAHYTFISTISVYKNYAMPTDEAAPVGMLEDPSVETVTGETYGPLKALCEQAAEAEMPGRVLNVRAGLIAGYYDPTDRFGYWPWKVMQGGDFAAPESPAYPMQIIDARDIADWVLRMALAGKGGVYNVTGPTVTLGDIISTAQTVTDGEGAPIYMDSAFLLENGVQPWVDLPLWLPSEELDYRYMSQVDVRKAVTNGLTTRPLADTIQQAVGWISERPDSGGQLKAGMGSLREQALIKAWESR